MIKYDHAIKLIELNLTELSSRSSSRPAVLPHFGPNKCQPSLAALRTSVTPDSAMFDVTVSCQRLRPD